MPELARRITELEELAPRMKDALLAAHIESVETAEELGPELVTLWLQRVTPMLSSREIDTVLRELFKGKP